MASDIFLSLLGPPFSRTPGRQVSDEQRKPCFLPGSVLWGKWGAWRCLTDRWLGALKGLPLIIPQGHRKGVCPEDHRQSQMLWKGTVCITALSKKLRNVGKMILALKALKWGFAKSVTGMNL